MFPSIETLLGEVIGAIIFLILYETVFTKTFMYLKVRHLQGKWIHEDVNGNTIVVGERINHSIIKINWSDPLQLKLKSFDYANNSIEWNGNYKIDSSLAYAYGYWKYINSEFVGHHILHIIDNKRILVQATTHNQISFVYYFRKK